MNIETETIRGFISQYDSKKGLRRVANATFPALQYLPVFGSLEPTVITSIRQLLADLGEAQFLNLENLFRLANILASTSTEVNSESERVANDIAALFGGMEILKGLYKNNALNLNTVYLLVYDSSPKEILCQELLQLYRGLSDPLRSDSILDCLTRKSAPGGVYLYIKIIAFLSRLDPLPAIGSEVIDPKTRLVSLYEELLKVPLWDLGLIKAIIENLQQYPELLQSDANLKTIMKLKDPKKFLQIISLHPVINQEQFDFLTSNENNLNRCEHLNKIYQIFKNNGWDIDLYFNRIIKVEPELENKLFYAISRLGEIKTTTTCIPLILEQIITIPARGAELINAISQLNPDYLSPLTVKLLNNNSDRMDLIVQMINDLILKDLYSMQIQSILEHAPEHSLTVAQILLSLHQLNCLDPQLIEVIGYFPKSISNFLLINQCETTIEMDLNPDQIKEFLIILTLVKKAQLLNQSNVNLIISKLSSDLKLLPEFLNAVYSFMQMHQLNQINLEALISNAPQFRDLLTVLEIPFKDCPCWIIAELVPIDSSTIASAPLSAPGQPSFFHMPSYVQTKDDQAAWLRIQAMASSSTAPVPGSSTDFYSGTTYGFSPILR